MEEEAKIVLMTPEWAAELLKTRHPRERNIRPRAVLQLVRAFKAGAYMLNGDAIRLSSEGNLMDGSHRLTACVKSGCSFRTVLVVGLASEAYGSIDRGLKRRTGDDVKMAGMDHSNARAALAAKLCAMCCGPATTMYSGLTSMELMNIIQELREPIESVMPPSRTFRGSRGVSPPSAPLLGAVKVWMSMADAEKADKFWKDIHTGVGLSANDPAYVFREKVFRHLRAGSPVTPMKWVDLLTQAAAHTLRGTQITRLITRGVPRIHDLPGFSREQLYEFLAPHIHPGHAVPTKAAHRRNRQAA
jgi:hypothetical protein